MQETSAPIPPKPEGFLARWQSRQHGLLAGLRLRVLALVLAPGAAALLYVGLLDERFTRQAEEEITRSLHVSLHIAQREHARLLGDTEQFLGMLAALVRSGDQPAGSACRRLLEAVPLNTALHQNFGLLDPEGHILCAPLRPPQGAGFSGRGFVRDAVTSGRMSMSRYQIGPATGLPQIGFALPLRDADGAIRRLVFLTTHLDLFQQAYDDARLGPEYDMVVTDAAGTLLFSQPRQAELLGQPLPSRFALPDAAGSGLFVRHGVGGAARLAAMGEVSVGREQLRLSVGVPQAHIAARTGQLRSEALGLLALINLLAAALTWLVVERVLLSKIARMRRTADRWARGDLQARTGIAPGRGELRSLASDLDGMAAALAALTQRHASIIQAAGEGICGLDETGRVVFLNPAAEKMLGYPAATLQGQRLADVAGPYVDDPSGTSPGTAPAFPLRIDPGTAYRYAGVYFRRADGEALRADLSRAPLFEEGRQVGVVDVFEDRGEAYRTAQALADSEARLRAIIDAAPDAILIVGADGRVLFANEEAAKLSGYAQTTLSGLPAEALLPEDMRSDYLLKRLLAREDVAPSPLRAESRMRRADGKRVEIELGVAAFRTEEGRYVVALARDITERKRAQKELVELNETLERRVQLRTAAIERAYRDLEAFSYTVAHDLRSPLRSISGYVQIVQKHDAERMSGVGQEMFGRVQHGVERMDQMIEDILRYSRSGTGRVETTEIDMQAMVQEVLTELGEQPEAMRIELCPMPRVRGDRTMLKQVWLNLVGNALKFSAVREEPRIEIGCKHDEECVFYVADNGVGFDMAHADKLFGMFERLHRGDQFKGTGVGLAIVRRLVERHGGQIWAKAEPGRGATFYFSLGECLEETPTGRAPPST